MTILFYLSMLEVFKCCILSIKILDWLLTSNRLKNSFLNSIYSLAYHFLLRKNHILMVSLTCIDSLLMSLLDQIICMIMRHSIVILVWFTCFPRRFVHKIWIEWNQRGLNTFHTPATSYFSAKYSIDAKETEKRTYFWMVTILRPIDHNKCGNAFRRVRSL